MKLIDFQSMQGIIFQSNIPEYAGDFAQEIIVGDYARKKKREILSCIRHQIQMMKISNIIEWRECTHFSRSLFCF